MEDKVVFERASWAINLNALCLFVIAVYLPAGILHLGEFTKFTIVMLIFTSPAYLFAFFMGLKIWKLRNKRIILNERGLVIEGNSPEFIEWSEIWGISTDERRFSRVLVSFVTFDLGYRKVKMPLNTFNANPEAIVCAIKNGYANSKAKTDS